MTQINNVREMVMNEVLSRAQLVRELFEQKRDINKECGYAVDITPQMYRELFEREGIATRVVEIYPKACWEDQPTVVETEDAEQSDWEESGYRSRNYQCILHPVPDVPGGQI